MRTLIATVGALTVASAFICTGTAAATVSPEVTVTKKVTVSKRNGAVGAYLRLSTGSAVDYVPTAPYGSVDLEFSNAKLNRKALRCPAPKPSPGTTATCPNDTIVGTFKFELRVRDVNGLWQQCPDPSKFTMRYETKLANFSGNDVGQVTTSDIAPQGTVDFNVHQPVRVTLDFSSLIALAGFGLNPAFSASAPCDPLLNAGAQLTPWVSDLEFGINGSSKAKHPFLIAKNSRKKVGLKVETSGYGSP